MHPAEDNVSVGPLGSSVDAFFGPNWRKGPSARVHVVGREGSDLQSMAKEPGKGSPYEKLSVPSSITADKLMNFLYEGDTPEHMSWFKVKKFSSQTSTLQKSGNLSYSDPAARQITLERLGWSFKDCLEPVWIMLT